MISPVRIGLVGAGPWTKVFTGPMIAGAAARIDGVTFAGVWARRREAAAEVAHMFGTTGFDDFDEFLDACDALVFSLPPDVQAALASRAAAAGKALLLDKPIGLTLPDAERLHDAVTTAGVVSQVNLTNRFFPIVRQFLSEAASFDAYGGHASFFGDGCVEGTYFGTPWRVREGGLVDLGPHVLDGLHAAVGPIASIDASGEAHGLVLLTCEHANGRVSQAAISATCGQPTGLAVELVGPSGRLGYSVGEWDEPTRDAQFAAAMSNVITEFVAAARSGVSHQISVAHGLYLQRLIADAARQLR